MKWNVAVLSLFLAPSLLAQRMNSDAPHALDGRATSTAPWIDMVPASPATTTQPAELSLKPVSVQQLLIPPKALKEIQRSRKAFDAGDLHASNEHLEKALRIYPDLLEARFDLGGNYVRLHEYEKALPEFQQFVEGNPGVAQGHYALSVAFFALHRYAEAEAAARHARELDPEPVEYRYMLGNAVLAQGRATAEAKELLRQSEGKFPNASLILAQVLLNEGKIDDVVTELRAYLRSPDAINKASAECWVALLNGVASGTCAAQKTFPDFR